MSVYKQKGSKVWWMKFVHRGQLIRKSTGHTNKAEARKVEAALRFKLANGEYGILERKVVPTLAEFATNDFLQYIKTTFAAKPKTLSYYENGTKNLLACNKVADEKLDSITTDRIAGYVAKRQSNGLAVSSVNRELQVLRRMFALAQEWGKVEKPLPKVRRLSGEAPSRASDHARRRSHLPGQRCAAASGCRDASVGLWSPPRRSISSALGQCTQKRRRGAVRQDRKCASVHPSV